MWGQELMWGQENEALGGEPERWGLGEDSLLCHLPMLWRLVITILDY
ncbi:MAG: hypothetical protein AAGJ94_14460 [Pseudomonadota bacterium]